MEPKKTAKADLRRKSFLFFCIGMMITLSMVITAFNYKVNVTYDPTDLDTGIMIDLPPDVPITVHQPPPPRIEQPVIIAVPDNQEIREQLIDIDIETEPNETIAEVPPAPVVEPEEDPNKEFVAVEEDASPVGGRQAFYAYIAKNLKYPAPARRMGTEGTVYVTFVVEKDGSLTNVSVMKGIGSGCDEEAVRVVKESPKWNPGKQRHKPVRQRMSFAIVFKLQR